MKRPGVSVAWLVLLALLLAACGGGGRTAGPIPPDGGAPAGQSGGGAGSVSTAPPTTAGGEAQPGPATAAPAEGRIPEDVPIYQGAAHLQVDSRGATITYSARGTLQELFDFYETELEARGWSAVGGSDSLFGKLATVLRTKGDGRISVTMNGNPNTDEIFVQINLAR
ncbi:MAG: hypothetical protein HY784_01035 [Chloroflexi bacterium]|nr:hypothetical protein [Chloroflexota bacterium]